MAKITRIQRYLDENGLTQARFAEAFGVAQGTVSKLCAGKRGMSRSKSDLLKRLTGGALHAGNFDELVEVEDRACGPVDAQGADPASECST